MNFVDFLIKDVCQISYTTCPSIIFILFSSTCLYIHSFSSLFSLSIYLSPSPLQWLVWCKGEILICLKVSVKRCIEELKGRKFLLHKVTNIGSHPGRMKCLFILFTTMMMILWFFCGSILRENVTQLGRCCEITNVYIINAIYIIDYATFENSWIGGLFIPFNVNQYMIAIFCCVW